MVAGLVFAGSGCAEPAAQPAAMRRIPTNAVAAAPAVRGRSGPWDVWIIGAVADAVCMAPSSLHLIVDSAVIPATAGPPEFGPDISTPWLRIPVTHSSAA
jgi:hypothetical protein